MREWEFRSYFKWNTFGFSNAERQYKITLASVEWLVGVDTLWKARENLFVDWDFQPHHTCLKILCHSKQVIIQAAGGRDY